MYEKISIYIYIKIQRNLFVLYLKMVKISDCEYQNLPTSKNSVDEKQCLHLLIQKHVQRVDLTQLVSSKFIKIEQSAFVFKLHF